MLHSRKMQHQNSDIDDRTSEINDKNSEIRFMEWDGDDTNPIDHRSLEFPFHLLQQDNEVKFRDPLDRDGGVAIDTHLPQSAARQWMNANPVRTRANDELPQFFMNKIPARTYAEMTTSLLHTSAFGERVADPRLENYLRHAMFARQCMWDSLAREQCARLLQNDNLQHSMVFAPAYPSDPDIRILVHDFNIRLLHAAYSFFMENFRLVELGNQLVDYVTLDTLYKWMAEVDKKSAHLTGFSLLKDMARCVILYLARHEYLSRFVEIAAVERVDNGKRAGRNKSKRKWSPQNTGVECLRLTKRPDTNRSNNSRFFNDRAVHPLDRMLFMKIFECCNGEHRDDDDDDNDAEHDSIVVTVEQVLELLRPNPIFLMKGLLWTLRQCPAMFSTVYNTESNSCIVIFNRSVDSDLVPQFHRGYMESKSGQMDLYPGRTRKNTKVRKLKEKKKKKLEEAKMKRMRKRKRGSLHLSDDEENDDEEEEDEFSLSEHHLQFYVNEDDGDDKETSVEVNDAASDGGREGQNAECTSIGKAEKTNDGDQEAKSAETPESKKRRREELQKLGHVFIDVYGSLRDYQKRLAIECIRFLKDRQSDGFAIPIAELANRMVLLLPTLRAHERIEAVKRVAQHFSNIIQVKEDGTVLLVDDQIPQQDDISATLRNNDRDKLIFRETVSILKKEKSASMPIEDIADLVDMAILRADLQFTFSRIPDLFAIFTSKPSGDERPQRMVRLLKGHVDPAKVVLVSSKGKATRHDRRNPDISYYSD